MNLRHLVLSACAALSVQAAPPPVGYQIKEDLVTVDSFKGDKHDLPHGDTRLREKTQELKMEVRRSSPQVPETVELRWVVLIEDRSGRIRTATQGKTDLVCPLGQSTTSRSAPFVLREREWDRDRGGSGSMEDSVHGTGILLFANGVETAAKFSPPTCETAARKALESTPGEQVPGQRPPRRFPHPPRP